MRRIRELVNRDKFNYFLIVVYTLFLIVLMLGVGNLYGSVQDWLSQHSTIPDYFRMIFYDTGKLVPNFVFNLGAGQNIYNFSYYGLLSPIFLISYLLPFIDMTTYVMVSSCILYVMVGVLFYKFLRNNKFNKGVSLFLSILVVSLSPINYHMHHHIMFVSYIPFLIIALMGVDKYVNCGKSWLLILGSFLVIMTNYYYSVCSLIVIFIYGIYKIIDNKILIVKSIFSLGIRLGIAVMMAGVLLIPTLYTVLNGGRGNSSNVSLLDLFVPDFNELLYGNYTIGITSIFVVAVFGIIFIKRVRKSDLFLVISIILLTVFPMVTYLLNGGLYIRGKVLIPFVLIYLYILGRFIVYLFKNKVNYKWLVVINIVICIFMYVSGYDNILYYGIDLLLCLILIYFGVRYKNKSIIFIPTVIVILGISLGINSSENYVSVEYYDSVINSDIDNLVNNITSDREYYRIINDNISKEVANRVYNSNYYTVSMYSSLYNDLYYSFYNKYNNIRYRNYLIQAGSNNSLFNNFMGVRYIISEEDISYYDLVDSSGDFKLYYNDSAYPLIYVSKRIGSKKIMDSLEFPYNLEYLMNYTVVSEGEDEYYSNIYEYEDSNIDDSYDFLVDEEVSYNISLDEELVGKILFISFDMDYNNSCSIGDQTISINGVVNKLTCKSWLYHNGNSSFEYVISDSNISDLDVVVSKGNYKISNVKLYVMDNDRYDNYIDVNNLDIDKGNSEISFDVDIDNDSYIVTSIPYDEGFSAYVDGEEVEIEIVNEAFLGFKIDSGRHDVNIKYVSPWYNGGVMFSIIGFMGYGIFIIMENRKCRLDEKK